MPEPPHSRPSERLRPLVFAPRDFELEPESFPGTRPGSLAARSGFRDRPTIDAAATMRMPSLRPGIHLGPYEVADEIGSGSMGEVYRARDPRLGRQVAIKTLSRQMASDGLRLARFEQEARAASALSHPNIVAVFDTGWHEGVPFIVTELLEGEPLTERLGHGPLPVRKVLEWAIQIAEGLVAAHARGIVHRDLKPANLFLTRQGQLKILDFGVAKLTQPVEDVDGFSNTAVPVTMPGLILGTVGYMSPEQVKAEPVDIRSDQFSLGCVLYELLAGQPPFLRPSAAQTLGAVLRDDPESLADVNRRIPAPLAWLIERLLSKDPEDRYDSTRDLARDLKQALTRLPELSPPRTKPGPRRTIRKPGFAMLLGAAFAAGFIAAAWLPDRATKPAAIDLRAEDKVLASPEGSAAPSLAAASHHSHDLATFPRKRARHVISEPRLVDRPCRTPVRDADGIVVEQRDSNQRARLALNTDDL